MRHSFLGQIYKGNKKIFYCCVTVLLFSFLSMNTEKNFTPFVKWDMYSQKMNPNVSYLLFEFKADGKVINISNNLQNLFRRLLTQSLSGNQTWAYEQSLSVEERKKMSGEVTVYKTIFSGSYANWIKNYLEQFLNRPIDKLEINALYYSFSPENKFYVHSSENIFRQ